MAFLATWAHTGSCSAAVTNTSRHFPAALPRACSVHGVVVTQEQDPALGLVEPLTIGLDPFQTLFSPKTTHQQKIPNFEYYETNLDTTYLLDTE